MKLYVVLFLSMFLVPSVCIAGDFEFPKLDPKANTQDRMESLNIPEDILDSMDTEELLTVCLKWPYSNMATFAFNNDHQAERYLWENFNGYRELFQRADAGSILLKRYMATQVNSDVKEQIKIELIERLLLASAVFDKLLPVEKEDLKKKALERFPLVRNQSKRGEGGHEEQTSKVLLRFLKVSKPSKVIDLTEDEDADWLIKQLSK